MLRPVWAEIARFRVANRMRTARGSWFPAELLYGCTFSAMPRFGEFRFRDDYLAL